MKVLLMPLALIRVMYQGMMLALGQILTNPMRSILTALGIIVGVGAVTVVVAALQGLQSNVLNEFESFGTNKMYIMPRWPDEGTMQHASWRLIRFYPEQFDGILENCPSVSNITLIGGYGATINFGDKSMNVEITGIEPDWHEIENRSVIIGRTFSHTDEIEARQVCLITEDTRDRLRLDRDCTGQSILINNRRFIVIGVLEPNPESVMFRDSSRDAEIFIPFTTAWKQHEPWIYAVATSSKPELSDEARAEIRFFLRRTRRLAPGEPDTFRIEVMQKFLDDFNNMAKMIKIVAFGIVAVSLLVGGIGIMNIMLVSVSERTREIGLRKAVGARPTAILWQFLIEAITLCLVGGLMGLVLGQVLTLVMITFDKMGLARAYIPVWAMVLSFGFSISVGIIFGMFPAFKASRLDPIQALRHE